ncbi:unnamed protein product [Linum tenue]|uniref:Terpene synthase metal-binding domain-containing protein n=1 Tax=Linum tenue TaxID=586396 RepID=A0AAV0NDJ3_9ROSI|nr:unnamed protein product [Linum tenue]
MILVDDTYDNYATYEELQILTKAIERLEIEALETLPDTMKDIYHIILNTYEEIKMELGKIGCSFGAEYAKAEMERKREHVASAVDCYMKEHAKSQEEATEIIWKEISKAWKDITEMHQKPTPLPAALIERLLNYARFYHVLYEQGDAYTHPQLMKAQVASLFVNPVPL